MLVGIDEWEELQARLFWLANGDGLAQDIAQARSEIAGGEGFGEDEVRSRFGVPKR